MVTPVEIDFKYKPIPVHIPFHRSTAFERFLFGAFGSGKSYALCSEAIAWALEQPGIRGLIVRKTVPELRDTTEAVFFDILPPELRAAGEVKKRGGHISDFIFPNGSHVMFRSIDDWQKLKSLNVGFIAYDEADEFDLETYLGMKSRVRQRDPTAEGKKYGATEITRRGIWSASNPAGHNWLYHRSGIEMVNADLTQVAKDAAAFRSTSFDNPYLPPEFLEELLDYPETWVKRYVLCQFDDFGGQIYEEWNWDDHTIPQADLPSNVFSSGSVFWMGMDPGIGRSPTAGLWVYVHPKTRELIGVKEYEETNVAAHVHAEAFRSIEAELRGNVNWRVGDPSLMRRDPATATSLHTTYQRLGYNFQLGPKSHGTRIPALGQMIHLRRFKVVRETCPRTYEAIKQYKWADQGPAARARGEDAPETPYKHNDHLVDCGQYVCSRYVRPLKPEVQGPYDERQELNDEIHRTIRKQMGIKKLLRGRSHDLGGISV